MKTIALIPARGGSKRVKYKNLVDLGGLPLLAYSILAAQMTPEISDIFVSSENPLILRIAEKYKAIPIKRPHLLAGDESTDLDVIRHFMKKLDNFDYLVYLRPTTPFRKSLHLSRAIYQFSKLPQFTSLRSVHEMSESAFKCCTMDNNNKLYGIKFDFNKPNQQYAKTFQPNGYVDILPASGEWGDKIYGYVTPKVSEIDTMDDLLRITMELKAMGGEYEF